jgi:hypothetical protein
MDAAAGLVGEVYELLRRQEVTQFAYLPHAGLRMLIDRSLADPAAPPHLLSTARCAAERDHSAHACVTG